MKRSCVQRSSRNSGRGRSGRWADRLRTARPRCSSGCCTRSPTHVATTSRSGASPRRASKRSPSSRGAGAARDWQRAAAASASDDGGDGDDEMWGPRVGYVDGEGQGDLSAVIQGTIDERVGSPPAARRGAVLRLGYRRRAHTPAPRRAPRHGRAAGRDVLRALLSGAPASRRSGLCACSSATCASAAARAARRLLGHVAAPHLRLLLRSLYVAYSANGNLQRRRWRRGGARAAATRRPPPRPARRWAHRRRVRGADAGGGLRERPVGARQARRRCYARGEVRRRAASGPRDRVRGRRRDAARLQARRKRVLVRPARRRQLGAAIRRPRPRTARRGAHAAAARRRAASSGAAAAAAPPSARARGCMRSIVLDGGCSSPPRRCGATAASSPSAPSNIVHPTRRRPPLDAWRRRATSSSSSTSSTSTVATSRRPPRARRGDNGKRSEADARRRCARGGWLRRGSAHRRSRARAPNGTRDWSRRRRRPTCRTSAATGASSSTTASRGSATPSLWRSLARASATAARSASSASAAATATGAAVPTAAALASRGSATSAVRGGLSSLCGSILMVPSSASASPRRAPCRRPPRLRSAAVVYHVSEGELRPHAVLASAAEALLTDCLARSSCRRCPHLQRRERLDAPVPRCGRCGRRRSRSSGA